MIDSPTVSIDADRKRNYNHIVKELHLLSTVQLPTTWIIMSSIHSFLP